MTKLITSKKKGCTRSYLLTYFFYTINVCYLIKKVGNFSFFKSKYTVTST